MRRPKTGMGSSAFFLLGYGGRPNCHKDTDDFDFADPYFRLRRIHSLFESGARLTDPVEFLTRLHYRGIRCKRPATGGVLQRLASLLHEHIGVECIGWLERACDFKKEWAKPERAKAASRRSGAGRRAPSARCPSNEHRSAGYPGADPVGSSRPILPARHVSALGEAHGCALAENPICGHAGPTIPRAFAARAAGGDLPDPYALYPSGR